MNQDRLLPTSPKPVSVQLSPEGLARYDVVVASFSFGNVSIHFNIASTDDNYHRFLLAQLLMDSFKEKLTVKDVKIALKTLPKGSDAYDVAYAAAMERIFAQGEQSSETARKILSWILCAHRPLSTLELLHSLAVEVDDEESDAGHTLDEDNFMDTGQLLTICAGLVTIDEQGGNVRFIHYTTQEYLQRNRETWLPGADVDIARICTAYLSLNDLSAGPCSTKQDYDRRVRALALLDYAAVYWGSHMKALVEADFASEHGSEIGIQATALLSNVDCLSSASQALFMSGRNLFTEGTISREGEGFLGSHWIGRFDLALLFDRWDSCGAQWDQRDFGGRTPLSWAAGEGNEALSKLLLETGKVKADSRDYYGRTPLSWAAGNGYEAIAKLLLGHKADVNSKDIYGETPLLWATQDGQEAVIKLLLGSEMIEVSSRDDNGWTPLLWAVRRKDEGIVQLLLNTRQVDVESQNKHGETPLSWAATRGNGAIVKLLLDSSDVDIEAKTTDGRTLLSLASETGQEAAVKLLLDTGKTDVNFKDDIGQTPLLLAAKNNHEAVVKLLLETAKVDVDWKDSFGKTALLWAARNGQEAVVKLLLDTGMVDVNSRDDYGWTPLGCATEKGYGVIIKLLQDTGKVEAAP
jgi:ankyrin repeat protein